MDIPVSIKTLSGCPQAAGGDWKNPRHQPPINIFPSLRIRASLLRMKALLWPSLWHGFILFFTTKHYFYYLYHQLLLLFSHFLPCMKVHSVNLRGGPVGKTAHPLQGAWVQSLVQKLRSHMTCRVTAEKEKPLASSKIIILLLNWIFLSPYINTIDLFLPVLSVKFLQHL